LIKKEITIPWLHIAEEVTKEAVGNNFNKIGILGTKFLMEGPVYPEKLKEMGIGYEIPEEDQRNHINKVIFNELVYGIIKEESKAFFLGVIDELKLKGCDSVVLGCTEIPLIVTPEESSLPTLDSTRILARAALEYSINQDFSND
jgi:aspartate racemase